MKKITILLFAVVISLGSFAGIGEAKFDHTSWDKLLQKHVTAKGNVNYSGFKSDQTQFDEYLAALAVKKPSSDWSREDAMAYWINAYNAFTVKLILNNYPISSIMKINGGKAWDLKFITIAGEKYSLNNIEHDILRKTYKDARIHFAVNCASVSCPKLLNGAFFAESLEKQLDAATKYFVNNDSKNSISANKAQISSLFDWYKSDFTMNGTVVDFLNKYSTTKLTTSKISYKDYNWNLNK